MLKIRISCVFWYKSFRELKPRIPEAELPNTLQMWRNLTNAFQDRNLTLLIKKLTPRLKTKL